MKKKIENPVMIDKMSSVTKKDYIIIIIVIIILSVITALFFSI